MKISAFSNRVKKTVALILIGYMSIFSPAVTLAMVGQPVSAPVTVPVIIPIPTPAPTPSATPTPLPIPVLKAPKMVYPKNGQKLDLEGAYMFKVKPVAGASGYLFGLFQDNVMVYENYRDSKSLSPNGEFVLGESNPFHSKFKAGKVDVMIRAMVNGRWTEARKITIILKARKPINTPKADLTVGIKTSVDQSKITLTATVKNIGSANSQPSVTQINKEDNSNEYWRLKTDALAAGASQTLVITTFKGDGSYQFLAKADADSQINESNENNNTASAVAVVQMVKPVISSVWPFNLRLGGLFIISGKEFGNSGTINLYTQTPKTDGIKAVTYYWSNSLIVGQITNSIEGNQIYTIQVQPDLTKNFSLVSRYISK